MDAHFRCHRIISFVSVTQSFNTTSSMGRLTLNVLLSFAQFEREVIGERVRDKITASKRKGLWVRQTVQNAGDECAIAGRPQTNSAQSGIRAACAGRQGELSDRRCMTTAATRTISFTLNGEPVSAVIATHHTLLEVVVLNCWVTDTNETPCASKLSMSLAKSASERVSRSTL